jgi:four helix bundle protein
MGQPHENLIAWQRADNLCVEIFELARNRFPHQERYGLSAQLKRAAFSVAANIVEGYAFPEGPMRLRHLRIAIASLAEVSYALHLACRVGYLNEPAYATLVKQTQRTAAPLHGLLQRSRKAIQEKKKRTD